MKLFRKIKYRLRRFIISLISFLFLCSVFIVSVSADVLPISENGYYTYVQPYYWNGTEWIYSNSFTFEPGLSVNTGLTVPQGNQFGMTFRTTNGEGEAYNGFNVSYGVLHFRIAFVSNIYFTSPLVPYVSFGRWTYDSEAGEDTVISRTVESNNVTYYSTTEAYDGSGSNRRWLVTTDIYVDSKYIPYHEFSTFYFYVQRDKSPNTAQWSILCKEYTAEVLTGADVPKYSQPDTSAKNELDSVEGDLKGNIDSFGSDIGSIFSFDDLYDLVVPGITFWGTTLEDFFNLDFVRPILILSLACGIFALLFGLVGTLVSRSNTKQSQSKSNKSKGG